MADFANINVPALAPGAAPTTNNATAGPDRFPAAVGGKYMVIYNNSGGAPITVTYDDPTSVTPANATAFNPDVPVVVTNAQRRVSFIDATRFRDSAGFINLAYSATPTMTVEIHGPL